MDHNSEEVAEAIVLFMNLAEKFWQYKKMKRLRKANHRTLIHINRPSIYCVEGLTSAIFRAVIEKNDERVGEHLRLSIQAFEKVVEYSERFLSSNRGWQKHFYITVFLYWLACGASYRVTGASFNISRYTVRDIVHKCLDGFLDLLPNVIKYPTENMYEQIGDKFNRRGRTGIFGNALGAIDGTHIKVSERVLQNSKLFRDQKFPPPGYFLLGDSGYKCRMRPIAIITPFKRVRQLTEREVRFNELHSKARTIIESLFGIMKSRWRSIFDKVLQLKVENCIKTIAVACAMHNICLNDGFENEVEVEIESLDNELTNIDEDDHDAVELRRALTEWIIL